MELTAPYMHDGRLPTLGAVLDHYASASSSAGGPSRSPRPTGFELGRQERADLLEFLRSLTDTDFVADPRLSDPFERPPDRRAPSAGQRPDDG